MDTQSLKRIYTETLLLDINITCNYLHCNYNLEIYYTYFNIQIFIKYNGILPSSAPVERMFSLATHVNSAKRNRIGDNTFEYI